MNTTSVNKKFSLKFNFFDVLVAFLATILAISLIVINNVMFKTDENYDNKVANVYYDSELIKSKPFKEIEDGEEFEIILKKKEYPLLLDDMTILISKEKGVRIAEEKSPQKICSRQGWVDKTEVPVVCLPNSVYVVIQDLNQVDMDITLE